MHISVQVVGRRILPNKERVARKEQCQGNLVGVLLVDSGSVVEDGSQALQVQTEERELR